MTQTTKHQRYAYKKPARKKPALKRFFTND